MDAGIKIDFSEEQWSKLKGERADMWQTVSKETTCNRTQLAKQDGPRTWTLEGMEMDWS
jgi:hypothetical protein